MKKNILHLDLDTFFVSCERLIDSRLQKRPLLVGGTGDRGVVAACSYEARVFGVHSAMPMRMAKQLCPEAIILRGNSGIYSKFSNLVTDVVTEAVPLYEKTSVDEFYMDFTGTTNIYGSMYTLAVKLQKEILDKLLLPCSIGFHLFGFRTKHTASFGTVSIVPPELC